MIVANRDVALALAAQGVAVFPCQPGGEELKRPYRGVFWRKQSTTEIRQIEAWWDRWDGALPAIDLAKAGMLVIDVDRHGGPDGLTAWAALEAEHGKLFAPCVRTPSGGLHLYFRQPDPPLGNGRGALPPGIDVRGAGGYVIAADAELDDGRRYVREDSPHGLSFPPPWLIEMIRSRPAEPSPEPLPVPPRPEPSAPRIEAYAQAAIDAELDELRRTGKGGRNNALNTAAFKLGTMVGAGWIGEGEAAALLESAAADIGLVKEDGVRSVRATIRSGLSAGRQKPRALPPETEPAHNGAAIVAALTDGTLYDRETGEIVEPAGEDIESFTADELHGEEVPPRLWNVHGIIPAHTVTLLAGDGATGKSLIALQLAVATAVDTDWLGMDVAAGRVLYLSAEDEKKEMHRRLASIAEAKGIPLSEMGALRIVPLAGKDAVLAAPSGRSQILQPTRLWQRIEAMVRDWRPTLVVLDTLADLFAGEENSRAQARQFVGLLRGLAIQNETTVLMLTHPSLSGMASGSGNSGSTAWSNSVRSRLYLRRVLTKLDDEMTEVDPDLRIMSTKKANYGPSGAELRLKWSDGIFIQEKPPMAPGAFGIPSAALEAEHRFLALLDAFDREGRPVSEARTSGNYAPRVFAADPRAGGVSKSWFEQAMHALFAGGAIRSSEYGPPSDRRRRLVRTENLDDEAPE